MRAKQVSFLTLFFSLIIVSTTLALSIAPEGNTKVECPAACPCCADILPELNTLLSDLNDFKEGYTRVTSEPFDFNELKQQVKAREEASQRTQSQDPAVSGPAWDQYNEATRKIKEWEGDEKEFHDQAQKGFDTLEAEIAKIKELINRLKACECFADIDACCISSGPPCSTYLNNLLHKVERYAQALPELRRTESNTHLAIMSMLSHYTESMAETAKKADKEFADAIKKLPDIDLSGLQIVEDCCKKGSDQCLDDFVTGRKSKPLDWLIQSGMVTTDLKGKDVATGEFGQLTLTNHTGSPVTFLIPKGTTLIPNDNDVQRMITTTTVRGTIPPGGSTTVKLKGACLDAGLYPPPSDGVIENPILSGPLSLGSIFENAFGSSEKTKEKTTTPRRRDVDSSAGKETANSFFDIFFGIDQPTGLFRELFSIPILSDVLTKMFQDGEIRPTGLPEEMERKTILQWSIWNIMEDFDYEDGREKIQEQVQESGGSQTPEQISQLNENVWANVNLVKKKARAKIAEKDEALKTGRRSRDNGRLANFKRLVLEGLWRLAQRVDVPVVSAQTEVTAAEVLAQADEQTRRALFVVSTLQHVVFDLEKLARDPYACRLAGVEDGAWVEPVRERMNHLRQKMIEQKVTFDSGRPLGAEDYARIRDYNAGFVASGGDFERFYVQLNDEIAPYRAQWEKTYKALSAKAVRAEAAGEEYWKPLSDEERKFFKIYARVKLGLAVLSKIYNQ